MVLRKYFVVQQLFTIGDECQTFETQEIFGMILNLENVFNSDTEMVWFVIARLVCQNHSSGQIHRIFFCICIVRIFMYWSKMRNPMTNIMAIVTTNFPEMASWKSIKLITICPIWRENCRLQIQITHENSSIFVS